MSEFEPQAIREKESSGHAEILTDGSREAMGIVFHAYCEWLNRIAQNGKARAENGTRPSVEVSETSDSQTFA
jgi:hypothetical protein